MRKIYFFIVNTSFIKSVIDSIKKYRAEAAVRNEKKQEAKALEHAISWFAGYAEKILEDYRHFQNSEYWFVEFLKYKGEYELRNDNHIYTIKLKRGFVIEITYQAQMMITEQGAYEMREEPSGYKLTSVILRKENQGYARIPSFRKQWVEYESFTIE